MHLNIANDLKQRFHSACALRGLKMTQVVSELIEEWLKAHETSTLTVESSPVCKDKVGTSE